MKASYKREMRHNYLILEAMEENLDSFELKMLAGKTHMIIALWTAG